MCPHRRGKGCRSQRGFGALRDWVYAFSRQDSPSLHHSPPLLLELALFAHAPPGGDRHSLYLSPWSHIAIFQKEREFPASRHVKTPGKNSIFPVRFPWGTQIDHWPGWWNTESSGSGYMPTLMVWRMGILFGSSTRITGLQWENSSFPKKEAVSV